MFRFTIKKVVFFLMILLTTVFAEPKFFLWEATKGEHTIYLHGSMHFVKKDFFPINPMYLKFFEKSDILVVEADISSDKNKSEIKEITEKIFYKDSDKLSNHLRSDVFKKVSSYFEKNGIKKQQLERLRVVALFDFDAQFTIRNLSLRSGTDDYFINLANKTSKRIVELESVKSQFLLLEELEVKMPNEMVNALLLYDENKSAKQKFDEIYDLWKVGNFAEFEKIIESQENSSLENKKVWETLNKNRNLIMMKKLRKMLLSKQKMFIVIGAAHFCGKNGLLKLLEEEGFKIKQVDAATK